jgi:hypothetical protein
MATSTIPKNAQEYIPYLKDQGIPNVTGAAAKGVSIQVHQVAMPSDGIVVFATHGLMDMADGSYVVLIHNHTTEAKQGKSALADRKATQLTIVGPAEGEILDVVLVGKLKGQIA